MIPVASGVVPHVYFPFWHLRAGDADVLVCATSEEVDEDVRSGHPWALTFRICAHVVGYALAAVLVHDLLDRAGLYAIAATAFDVPIESNPMELLLVTLGVTRGTATSELEPKERWPLVVGIVVPELTKPFVGPVLSVAFQLTSVTLVNLWFDERQGSGKPLRLTLVRSLELEAALVAGALGGRLFALLLLGTPGWALGDVIGGLVVASLVATPRRDPLPDCT